ncbi:hypothetical protein SDC9_163200 [bioreactor metagenome]|uniref:Uncharacterized protein n=1 Tax=bioreactor metagenome TaxID=1076179 RepID=A0A645FV15_9ZZZZ
MFQVIFCVGLSFKFHPFYKAVFGVVMGCIDHHILSVFQVYRCFFKERASQYILIGSGTNRVEAEGTKHIPCRRLSVVFVTTVSVRCRPIQTVHHFTHPILGFPGFTGVIIEIGHVLNRLVAMCVVSHVHDLHFPYLVDHKTIIAFIEQRGKIEHRVEHLVECSLPSHQAD